MTLPDAPTRAPEVIPQDIPHSATDAELRRAYEAAKVLAERLELCGLLREHRHAVAIREVVFMELVALDRREGGR